MDVASCADRHLDIPNFDLGLQVVEAHPSFPYFLEKRLAIPTSPFFINYIVNGFCATSIIYISMHPNFNCTH